MMLDDDDDDDGGPAAAQRTFFEALRAGDVRALAEVLADAFLMIDATRVMAKREFLRAVEDARLQYDEIRVVESRLRRYGDAAVFTGRTEMRRRFGAVAWSVRACFTHVFVVEHGRFRLVSAHANP